MGDHLPACRQWPNAKHDRGRGNAPAAPAAKSPKPKAIEQYDHKDKKRANNPPVGLVTPETDPLATEQKTYEYDPHLDPQLVWAGKAEHTSFEVPTVSLHVHERIDPRTIIEATRRRSGDGNGSGQMLLFEQPEQNPPLRAAIEFYKHAHGWTNRLIAGDSLLVMNSLLEKEGMAGKALHTTRRPQSANAHRGFTTLVHWDGHVSLDGGPA